MKKNWIKGLDRVAVVTAVPIAIFFGIYGAHEFTNNNRLFSARPHMAESHYTISPNVQDIPHDQAREWAMDWWLSDSGAIEVLKKLNKSRAPELAEGLNKGLNLGNLKLISPGIPARIFVGLLWAIAAGIISVLAVSGSTRGGPKILRWLQSGFALEEPKNKKK